MSDGHWRTQGYVPLEAHSIAKELDIPGATGMRNRSDLQDPPGSTEKSG